MSYTQKNLYKKLFGRSGERRAARYLKRHRYKIIEKNYVTKIGEIDIIALKGGVYVFVEVKTRVDDAFGRPAEAVNFSKQRKYRLMALQYASRLGDVPIRFDIIEILGKEINHIENAF